MYGSTVPFCLSKIIKNQAILHLAEEMKAWHHTLYNHALNVAFLTHDVAINIGVNGSELEQVIQGAFLHDIGKIAWPGQLVSKLQLDKEDWQIIRGHPIMGEHYLRDQAPDTPDLVLRIIREHHERPDGGGYPNLLKADEIHPLSLMVSTFLVYVALTENRPYRPAWRKNDAFAELKRQGLPEEIIKSIRKNTADNRVV
jgi:putative nucleotidyltransferase with HDIG domain